MAKTKSGIKELPAASDLVRVGAVVPREKRTAFKIATARRGETIQDAISQFIDRYIRSAK